MKNNILRISLVVLLLAMVTMSVISGTLAKYVETVYGTDSARVAKFDYVATAGGTALTTTTSPKQTINLFNTANDAEVYGASQNINSEKLVAPGTFGHFDVVTTNKSEVKVDVTYSITETQSNNPKDIPIVYFVQPAGSSSVLYYSDVVPVGQTVALGSDVADYLDDLVEGEITAASRVAITGNLAAMSSALGTQMAATDKTDTTWVTKTDNVGWFWAFGDATNNVDTADTTLGKAGTATVTIDLGVTFTQVD